MENKCNTKFRIKLDKGWNGIWGFGITLSHVFSETYLHIGLFKWSINIGIMCTDEEKYFIDTII